MVKQQSGRKEGSPVIDRIEFCSYLVVRLLFCLIRHEPAIEIEMSLSPLSE